MRMELSDLKNLGVLESLEAELAEMLAEEDVAHLAAAMGPGSTAGVIVYENLGCTLLICRAPRRRATHRQRPDPHPSHHRLDRGG